MSTSKLTYETAKRGGNSPITAETHPRDILLKSAAGTMARLAHERAADWDDSIKIMSEADNSSMRHISACSLCLESVKFYLESQNSAKIDIPHISAEDI